MNLAKALKVKKRLAARIKSLQDIWRTVNTRKLGEGSIDLKAVELELTQAVERLIALKAAIYRANGPIADKLEFLAELKSSLVFFQQLPVGQKEHYNDYSNPPILIRNEIYLNEADKQNRITAIQTRIDNLQDEIDDFNAATQISV